MKLNIRQLIVALFLGLMFGMRLFPSDIIPLEMEEYTSLTEEEAELWWSSLSKEEKLDFIITYDRVEHSFPKLEFPSYISVLSETADGLASGDLVAYPKYSTFDEQGGYATLTIGEHLRYKIRFPEMRFHRMISLQSDKPPPNNINWFLIGFASGFVVGAGVVVGAALLLQ